ncbi:MAG TPA: DUF2079 domain-containing protein [Ktedonobacterales bacterium]|nr:DUF2079 domain-containing protein [Ktedonobacterales bacterium]
MSASDARHADESRDGEEQAITAKRPTIPRARAASIVPDAPNAPTTPREWLARLLDRYPDLPPSLEGRGARIAFWFVVACAAAYTIFFAVYLFATQDAWLTHAEDMGIMTQALWNTTHGAPLHQTICNTISDTNCIGDVSRFAIHFEPLMLPIALIYAIVPSPKTLQLLQAAVVASGALPAFWLASRRLRSALAGVAFALLYLAYPPLQAAVVYDFHAVTLTAAFLMFALYFMMTRNNLGLFIACLLALATKEEIPLDVLMIAASIMLLQRRWRTGGALAGLAVGWLVVELLIMRAASPLGHSPTASRYAQFGASPIEVALTLLTHPIMIVRQYVLSAIGVYYLRTVLTPVGYLAILSPWALAMAAPALAINLLSSDPTMQTGAYQYNAEITPFIIFAAIDAVWWLSLAGGWLARWLARFTPALTAAGDTLAAWARRAASWPWPRLVMAGLTVFAFAFGARGAREHSQTPLSVVFSWPQQTAHTRLGDQLVHLIPPDASVCAQSDLVPHVSNRRFVYLFPYQMLSADYIFLDVTASLYPQTDRDAYAEQAQTLLRNPAYHVIAATDGYLLLKRGAGRALNPSDPYGLPPSFYTFVTRAGTPSHTLDARFGPSLELVGYDISPADTIYAQNPFLRVVTYWRVSTPLSSPVYPEISLAGPGGATLSTTTSAAMEWLPMTHWLPGAVYRVDSGPFQVSHASAGRNLVGVRVLAGAPGDALARPLTATLDHAASGPVSLEDDSTRLILAIEQIR